MQLCPIYSAISGFFTGKKNKNLRVIPDKRCAWASHLEQHPKVLNKYNILSIRNGLTLYKQLKHPLMDYAFTVWRHALKNYMRRFHAICSICRYTLVHQQFTAAQGPIDSQSCQTQQESARVLTLKFPIQRTLKFDNLRGISSAL